MRNAFIFALLLVSSTLAKKNYFCSVPVNMDESAPLLHLKDGTFGYENFNAISFSSFTSKSGDVEGRTIVKGDVSISSYSFGYEIVNTGVNALDKTLPDSLVVGGNVKWNGGALYPDGTGLPYTGIKESAFIGGTNNVIKQVSYSSDSSSSLSTILSDLTLAQKYFGNMSNAFAALPVNGQVAVKDSEKKLTCASTSTTVNVFQLTTQQMKAGTFYTLVNCNKDSAVIINIIGSDDVTFNGDEIYHTNENLVINIVGSGRTIFTTTTVRGNVLAPYNTINMKNNALIKGLVVAANLINIRQINRVQCVVPVEPQEAPQCVPWDGMCAGLVNDKFSFINYNAISFGDFNAKTGDVEGRVAAAGACNIGSGYSVGAVLFTMNDTPDKSSNYSLICRDLTFGSGEVYPNGANILGAGDAELIHVSGSSEVPSNLESRVVGQGEDFSSKFEDAQACYKSKSADMAAKTPNTVATVSYQGLYITCLDKDAAEYVVKVDGTVMSSITYYVTSGCNFNSRYVINIVGSGDFELTGDNFPAVPTSVTYNVIGCGNMVNIHDTTLAGNVLAPCSTVAQTSGAINGKVVAGSIAFSTQINRENVCTKEVVIRKNIICKGTNAAGSFFNVYGASDLRVKDNTLNGVIKAINGDQVTFDGILNGCNDGQYLSTAIIPSTASRYAYPNESTNGASTVAVTVAAIAVAALLI